MIFDYLKNIAQTTSAGDAREESYYSHLAALLQNFSTEKNKTKIHITTLPKKTEAGNPDFRIWDGEQKIIGYVEAKKPGENLDVIEQSEQLLRYRKTFANLILTDFYEFRLYRNGELIDKTFIGRPFIASKLKTIPPVENEEVFFNLLHKFFAFSFPKIFTAESLAAELAKRTSFLRDEVVSIELQEEKQGKGKIFGFYTAFKQYLVADLTTTDFADIYSQTITYGLFAARTRANGKFNRRLAFDLIPPTIGILKDVFQFISLGKIPVEMEVMIDDISAVLQAAEVNNILHQFYHQGKGEDPIVHFYETFLNVYDPATRERRGVYYTPEPVVQYMVKAVNDLLKSHFEMEDGWASKNITMLDPAGGTLTFPAEAIKLAVNEFVEKYGDGGKQNFIKNHILKNFYAFELMMAPYSIGHIKISFLLEELGYEMADDDRFKLYLTNTLDTEDLAQTQIPGLESLSAESHLAGAVKQKEKILVVLGNPPYSGHSATQNKWTEKLLKENLDGAQSYFEIDGKDLGEKNPKWLQDDYVKFLRFAQWKISKAGEGIVAMITNHSYLDNPTFRGMRQSLQNTFNEIYVIDLHGNAKKKETSPNGSKDENVFDIQQGVAIAIFVKTNSSIKPNKKSSASTPSPSERAGVRSDVYHKHLFGTRKQKYDWLSTAKFAKKDFEKLKPASPFYFLIPTNTAAIAHYNKWLKVNEIFPVNSVGIVTARDAMTIDMNPIDLTNRVRLFSKMNVDLARQTFELGKDARDWKIDLAQADLKNVNIDKDSAVAIDYRPFDTRFTFYTGNSKGFHCMPRGDVMRHMLKENLGLCVGRQGQVVGNESLWNLAMITNGIVDFNLFYRGGEILCPLYLYPDEIKKKKSVLAAGMMLFEPEVEYGAKAKEKVPNIDAALLEKISLTLNTASPQPSPKEREQGIPELILGYCYGILYSNIYRTKYAEFLRFDFPRVPFTTDANLFLQMANLGNEIIDVHLMRSKTLQKPIAKYMGKGGDDVVKKIVYDAVEEKLFINEVKYFSGVSAALMNYQIGGYKVIEHYLKDRKGKALIDPLQVCKIITALSQTIELQTKCDEIFEAIEKGMSL